VTVLVKLLFFPLANIVLRVDGEDEIGAAATGAAEGTLSDTR